MAGWVVLFTALRAITIEWFLTPLAKYMRVTPVKNQLRVAEQGWLVLYYGIFWTLGMVHTPFNARQRGRGADS